MKEINNRPDGWDFANGFLELAIAAAGIFGGAYGIKLAVFLKQARDKSKALHEIISGNELFKTQNSSTRDAFKVIHQNQSPKTKRIVSEIKNP